MDRDKFRKDFKQSGLTQKAYGETIGMSSSMVHYYLRKSQDRPTTKQSFAEVKVINSSPVQMIRITTSQGTEISIPL